MQAQSKSLGMLRGSIRYRSSTVGALSTAICISSLWNGISHRWICVDVQYQVERETSNHYFGHVVALAIKVEVVTALTRFCGVKEIQSIAFVRVQFLGV